MINMIVITRKLFRHIANYKILPQRRNEFPPAERRKEIAALIRFHEARPGHGRRRSTVQISRYVKPRWPQGSEECQFPILCLTFQLTPPPSGHTRLKGSKWSRNESRGSKRDTNGAVLLDACRPFPLETAEFFDPRVRSRSRWRNSRFHFGF